MCKYWITYKNSLAKFLQYRLNLSLLFVSHIVTFSGMFYLWIAIYGAGQKMGNYTLTEIILYYVILTVVQITVANGVGMGFQVCEEINQGNVTNYLLKPYSFVIETLVKLFGEATINILLLSPIVALISFLGRNIFPIPPLSHWLLFLGVLLISELFYFFFYFLAALSSFWFVRGRSFIYLMLIVNLFLNGSMIPLDLFPKQFQTLSSFLPFQFLIFTPIQAFLGRITNWPQIILVACVWAIFFGLTLSVVWKKGVRSYEAVGR
jgi:ABC-2 type transport system permease protein